MYYTQVHQKYVKPSTYDVLTQPPFQVLDEIPGNGAFIALDEDSLPLLRCSLEENEFVGRVCDDKR